MTIVAPAWAVGSLVELPLELVDGDNYRAEAADKVRGLASEIEAAGRVHTPARVYERGGRFVLIAGHHRAAALRLLGWPTLPAIVEAAPSSRGAAILAAVADNATRVVPSPVDEANAIARAMSADAMSVDQVAAAMGKPVSWVARRLMLLHPTGAATRVGS